MTHISQTSNWRKEINNIFSMLLRLGSFSCSVIKFTDSFLSPLYSDIGNLPGSWYDEWLFFKLTLKYIIML